MRIALLLLLSALSMQAVAATIGEHLTPWTLQDQHDQPYTLDNDTHVLLVARSMDGSKLVKAALENQPKGYLEARHVAFLADVKGMPSIIGKFIAIPKMRDYTYRVVLDRDGKIAAQYPGAEDKVLWLQLDNGTLVSQQDFANADELRAALEKLPVQ
ncbi:FAD/FMN-containing dehydrogenase [Pseudomonas sp. CCC3.1]|uniref:FAD/FMN-containing dehydrogenase n=1 Tax=Pseudomonas sp. CCC3.1 TaxID=3048607 RepID=UPI002AC9196F|nr:FAD/FMN-containing dehydrogenase [Pseudomonas sp. CCC3.1]MEB0206158.1 FAD/FMN-containing dehydrogenase [Pseudomonas sp. CCC3.1]WPX34473.1 FAD/FMN-containing dehydrogenase [Pseudomonas sp. CCC3.1]